MHTSFLKKARCKVSWSLVAVFSKNLSQDNCGWTLLVSLTVPPSSLTALCWTWTNKSPRQELAVREEDSLLKRNRISAPPGVTVAPDQNRSSLISVLPGATVQDQRQASLTEVRYWRKRVRIFLIYIKIRARLGVEGQVVSLGQARARLGTLVMMFNFIGLGLALALVQEIYAQRRGLITPVALVQKWPTGVPLCQWRLGGLPNVL